MMFAPRRQITQHKQAAASVLLASLFLGAPILAADWPQYRGPNHDGISTETIRTNWDEAPPIELWKVTVDPGLSSLTIANGRLLTMVRREVDGIGNREFVLALNADTGVELWATHFDRAYYPNGGVGSEDGPRGTPIIDGEFVYAFGAHLKLVCLRADNGAVVWQRDFVQEFSSSVIGWQNAASPLLVNDRLFVNCNAPEGGRLTAINKVDGTEIWRTAPNDAMTHATPIAANIHGIPQIIFFTQSGLVALDPDQGTELWRYAFPYSTSTAASPVVCGDIVYCSANYARGAGAVRIAHDGDTLIPTEVWRKPNAVMNHWSTPVYQDGYLYGHYNSSLLQFKAYDVATGTEQWLEPNNPGATRFGYGGVVMVGDYLLILSDGRSKSNLTDGGNLVLARIDPTGYHEVANYTNNPLVGLCWNAPAVSNGRIYARSSREIVALDVSIPQPPQVTGQPESQTVEAGATTTFTVTATGSEPLHYQWRLDTVNLEEATEATLTLNAITSDQAGSYDVVVSNSAGTATSDAATLTVTTPEPPLFTQAEVQAGEIVLHWTGSGVLQRTEQLDGNWTDVEGAEPGYSEPVDPSQAVLFRIRPAD